MVDFWKLRRTPIAGLPSLDIHDPRQSPMACKIRFAPNYWPPPTATPPSEGDSVNAIGKYSAISSSKQQPLLAALDELLYRRSTEDV
jgi:hypothetical protein